MLKSVRLRLMKSVCDRTESGLKRMSLHFFQEMERLHRDIVSMCSTVEENISEAVNGLQNRSHGLAEELAVRDRDVNELDIRIEEECLKILALYHPVANDLRRVSAVLKIIGELERVGDLAVNIAERSASMAEHPDFPLPARLNEMARESLAMLHSSIDAYIEMDAQKAKDVCAQDDVVDELNVVLLDQLRQDMVDNPALIEPGMHLFSVIRHIERVADHATNIAEDVVYLIKGEIIRHRGSSA
jgi:phosphate transport system protein